MALIKVPLLQLATARSGDKGNHVNIGLIARSAEIYSFLKENITDSVVSKHFAAFSPERVVRYELPHLLAFNFMLFNVLAGGGSLSLRTDAQGKTFGQALLLMDVAIPEKHPIITS